MNDNNDYTLLSRLKPEVRYKNRWLKKSHMVYEEKIENNKEDNKKDNELTLDNSKKEKKYIYKKLAIVVGYSNVGYSNKKKISKKS